MLRTPEQAAQVQILSRVTMLCYWSRNFTQLSKQEWQMVKIIWQLPGGLDLKSSLDSEKDKLWLQDFEVGSKGIKGIYTTLHNMALVIIIWTTRRLFCISHFNSSTSTYHNIKQWSFKVVMSNIICKGTFELSKCLEVGKTISRNKTFYDQLTKKIILYTGPDISLVITY